jgi:PAS domain S-box-containing protein
MDNGAAQARVFVVDDDRGLLRLIDKALRREGFTTETASSGKDAIHWLATHQADLMLLDLKLQDIGGQSLIQQLNDTKRCPPFIIITGQGDERVAVEMMKRGAIDYLVKDVDFLQFIPAVVKRALEELDTARRLAEAEEQVHLVRSVLERAFSAVVIASADHPEPLVLYVNPAFTEVTGHASEKVVGKPLGSLASLSILQERLRSGMPTGERFLDEVASYHTPQGERWGEWRVGPVQDKNGRNTHWLFIFRDITERKRLEQEIMEISDRERQRIGQDLHDGLCQHLAGIELMSQVLEQKLAPKSKTAAARVGEIGRYVREAISQTRLLARGLSPVTLEAEGLMSALEGLAANTGKMFGVTCRLECRHPVLVPDPVVATHMYRIAQEAVSNAIKHGRAREVVISLHTKDDRIFLCIDDNGIGLPKTAPNTHGMGLLIMQSRVGMIGGILSKGQSPSGGARIICSIPEPSKVPQVFGS